jgi:hypothetical protein
VAGLHLLWQCQKRPDSQLSNNSSIACHHCIPVCFLGFSDARNPSIRSVPNAQIPAELMDDIASAPLYVVLLNNSFHKSDVLIFTVLSLCWKVEVGL